MVRASRRFFSRRADVVARALLGKRLTHGDRSGLIVETEAYLGPEDAASHARFGATRRTAVMFGPAGFSYVYLCYGVYDLFNVVTGPQGSAQAVLIRALELLGPGENSPATARGPGKLTRALQIGRNHTGLDLTSEQCPISIARGRPIAAHRVCTGPRIGVGYAGAWAKKPFRFWISDHPAVSRQ